MCFNIEQVEHLRSGNVFVIVVYDDVRNKDEFASQAAFLTPAGLFDNESCGNAWAELVANVREGYLASGMEDKPKPREKQTITPDDVGDVKDVLG